MSADRRPVRIANCSGFYGDRLSAAAEVIRPDPIDVLSGDWLAELTMSILAKERVRGGGGFARTFLRQLEDVLVPCTESGVKIVSNAGAVSPEACAEQVQELAQRLGVNVTVAVVDGDDLSLRIAELIEGGEQFRHLDTGERWVGDPSNVQAANAYLGGHAISEALRNGADVVVTGRVADAALVSGAAAWWHGWNPNEFDKLAGATVAGHVIECGAQATGGNYAYFSDIADMTRPGFPIAEIAEDGSSVITKQPGSGGAVSIGTVKAQLLYEVIGPRYRVPDVVVRLDSLSLRQVGADRVEIRGTRGEPAPSLAKVLLTYPGGYRNSMTLAITGNDRGAKAALAERAVWEQIPGGQESFAQSLVEVVGAPLDAEGPVGQSYLRFTVADPDADIVGRRFSSAVVATGLSTYPGCYTTTPPARASEFLVGWPTLIDAAIAPARLRIFCRDGPREIPVPTPTRQPVPEDVPVTAPHADAIAVGTPTRNAPIGTLAGARSGDKGGNANIGLWVSDPAAYDWLLELAHPQVIAMLLPETRDLTIRCYPLPNLLAVNIIVVGLLGRGVAASLREDPQAKSLGERLRATEVPIPIALLGGNPAPHPYRRP
ncbi:acyclic terpene utilization AtuA family protein [Nocardia fusca]|uniref:acyclic terpene utilization AtuA family protein n=1 Tax=Nocardia fusca TaxID=941183 RepID=UPI0037A7D275